MSEELDLNTMSPQQRIERLEAIVARLESELLKKVPRFGVFVKETGELTRWQFDTFEEADETAKGMNDWSLRLIEDGTRFAFGDYRHIVKPIS